VKNKTRKEGRLKFYRTMAAPALYMGSKLGCQLRKSKAEYKLLKLISYRKIDDV
jgi:hypothetical protein